MKRAAMLLALLSFILLPGCSNSDRDKDKNKGKDIPKAEAPDRK